MSRSLGPRTARSLARATGRATVLVCLMAAACSSHGTTSDGPAPDTTGRAALGDFVPGDGDRSGLVDIGGGRNIYLECSDTGSPTIMLISGAGVAADNWSYTGAPNDEADPPKRTGSAAYPEVARFSRVFASVLEPNKWLAPRAYRPRFRSQLRHRATPPIFTSSCPSPNSRDLMYLSGTPGAG